MQIKSYTLREIANIIGAQLEGDPDCRIHGFASLQKATSGDVSFLVNSRYQMLATTRYEKFLSQTQASAVLLAPKHVSNCLAHKLIMDDPFQGLIQLAGLFQYQEQHLPEIHPSATIAKTSSLGSNVSIGPHCVIGENCHIADNSRIDANCVIGDFVVIGKDAHIYSNVSIYHSVRIGNKAVIHSGAVLGSDGFSMIRGTGGWQTIPHLGSVIIGDNVVVGANTTIDRGALEDTILENGVKLDNQIQIGHGVVIGENTVIAACVGIAGSTRIGKDCLIGGASGINDNIVIGDNVIFTGMSQVTKSILKPGIYSSGTGIQPQKMWHKTIARLHRLDAFFSKLRNLEKEEHAE